MKKINNFDKLLLVSIVLVAILNPLTGQYILLGINWCLDMAMLHGSAVISAPACYIIGYVVYKLHKSNRLTLPAKSKRTQKAGKFITT